MILVFSLFLPILICLPREKGTCEDVYSQPPLCYKSKDLRIEWRDRKARFLIIIKMVTIILILIIANSYIVLTIFKFYSRSCSPANNPRSLILL